MSKEVKKQEPETTKSSKKYIALAIVAILSAIGIMMNNGSEDETSATTMATTEQYPVTARIDISTPLVNADDPQFEVYVDDSEEAEQQAGWMPKYNYQGYSMEKQDEGEINIKIKALRTTDITIALRGIWDRDYVGDLIKHPITYTAFQINNENILTEPKTVWFAEPYEQSINIKAGDEYTINIKWQKANQ